MFGYSQPVEVNPRVMPGKPVVKGTRTTVETIAEEVKQSTQQKTF
jgi:uncharacterized protein (DUF433 family)